MKPFICFLLLLVGSGASSAQVPSPNQTQYFSKVTAATVVVLAGEGAGRLRDVATGVVISKDGVLLTAFHAVKGAQ